MLSLKILTFTLLSDFALFRLYGLLTKTTNSGKKTLIRSFFYMCFVIESYLNPMDLKSTKASPVLADPALINKSRLGIYSSLLPCSQSGLSFSTSGPKIQRKKLAKLDDVQSNGWLDAM